MPSTERTTLLPEGEPGAEIHIEPDRLHPGVATLKVSDNTGAQALVYLTEGDRRRLARALWPEVGS